jgi:uncharacterized Zn finger protein
MILTAECPECGTKWDVTEDAVRQPVRGPTVTIQCPECREIFKAGALRAHGFIVRKEYVQ